MPKGVYRKRGIPAECHPDQKNYASGLCISCYKKKDYERYKALPEERKREIRLRKYNITVEEYDSLFKKQNGKCAICKADSPRNGTRVKFMHVDHCHQTGEVRGLLCGPCNRGVGLLKDDPLLLMKAYQYLVLEIKK